MGVGHVGRVVGVLVGVVRVSVVGVVVEAAGVVVGHRDHGGLSQRSHAALAAGDMPDDSTRPGDGGRRRERPYEPGEVPWNPTLEIKFGSFKTSIKGALKIKAKKRK